MRKAAKLLAFLILLCASLPGQEIILEKYSEGVDFWILIPYNNINFKRDAGTAQYQLSLEVKNAENRQLSKLEEKLNIPRREWLKDSALPVLFKAELIPGKYKAVFKLRNLILGDQINLEKTFVVDETFTEIGQPYFILQKEGLRYIPADLQHISYPVDSIQIEHKFTIAADSIQIQVNDKRLSFIQPERAITAELTGLLTELQAERVEISLFEGNIRYHMEPFFYSQWFSYNAVYNGKDQLQQLRYIANQNEWRSLRAVPKNNYQEAIDGFWQVHDPSPGTIRNEAREGFYQRVITADERYTIHKRMKGWKSDRGRIYIKYGEPDETFSEVHPVGLYPYIVWTYYSENLEFTFADTGGFGQYTLRNKDEEY